MSRSRRMLIQVLIGAAVAVFGLALAPPFWAQSNAQSGTQASTQTSGQASAQAGTHQAGAHGAQASAGASSSTSAGPSSAALANGTAFNAELTSPVESKKAKPGDAVSARTTEAVSSDRKVVIPKGAKLIGHVTRASSRAKGDSESALAFTFDHAVLKNGEQVPLNVTLEALAASRSAVSSAAADTDAFAGADASAGGGAVASGGGAGRGAVGGVAGTARGTTGAVTNTAANVSGAAGGTVNSATHATGGLAATSPGAVGGLNSAGQLTSSSRGVFGLIGLSLSSAASNSTEGSVITSAGKNVRLDSGTRMLLVSQAAASATPQQ